MSEAHEHGHGHGESPLTRERAGSLGVGAAASVAALALLIQVIVGPMTKGAAEHQARTFPPGLQGEAQLILKNARVIQPGYERASAIALASGKILAVGGDEVLARSSATTIVQDMGGAAIVPGLRDAHAHVFELGAMLRGRVLDLTSLNQSRGEVLLAVGMWKKTHRLAPGEWIVGRGWDHTRWKVLVKPTREEILKAEKEHRDFSKEPNGGMHQVPAGLPDADLLDEAAPQNPVVLYSASGRIAWANWLALELAKITRDSFNPPGGRILRDPKGNPSGILLDSAVLAFDKVLEKTEDQAVHEAEEDFLAGAKACVQAGLVEVHVAGVDGVREQALRNLAKKGLLPLRVYGLANVEQAREPLMEQGLLAIRAVLVAADGGLDSHGARLLAPYEDEAGNTGIDGLGDDDLRGLARRCAEKGWQLCVEAGGDAAVKRVLSVLGEPGTARHRFRIEHADLASEAERFAKLDVIASMQPSHADFLARRGDMILGKRRAAAEPWKALLEGGVSIAFGSDAPADYRPLPGLANAARGGLTAEDALALYTVGPAYASFEEERRGKLLPGLDADLTVLAEDPLGVPAEKLGSVRVLATYLQGRESR